MNQNYLVDLPKRFKKAQPHKLLVIVACLNNVIVWRIWIVTGHEAVNKQMC